MDDADAGKAVAKQIKRLRNSGRVNDAIELGNASLTTIGRHPRILCSLGSAYQQKGDFLQAERLFEETLKINPHDEVALTSLGQVALAQGEYGKAEARFMETLKINPRNEVALNSLGQVVLAQGEHGKAEARFMETLKINPRNEVALLLSARLSMHQGKFTEAINCIKKQMEGYPHLSTLRIGKLMVEHGVGGDNWKQAYLFLLNIAGNSQLIPAQTIRTLLPHEHVSHHPESLSPKFFREMDEEIGKVTRSKLCQVGELYHLSPINAQAAHIVGLPAEQRDAYRRSGALR